MVTTCCSTNDAQETVGAKFHTSLNVTDLPRSIAFYRLLLGREPVKSRADYAKFELDDPPLVLTLMPGRPGAGGILNHFGLRVADADTLVGIQRRLEEAGVRTKREEGVDCCYARQTKFWVSDPDRAFWEIYVFHEDLDERGDGAVPEIGQFEGAANEAPPPRVVWEHRLGEPLPAKIPHGDHSVHEIQLEGSANASPQAGFPALLAETFRVLRPGGELRLHGLSGDRPLTEPLPALPGPAAAVEHVPAHREVVDALRAAGFVSIRLEKLSETAHFTVGGVGLREIVVTARKPGHRPQNAGHTAIYLGPLAEVIDDFGNCFRRGESTALNIQDWQALANSSVAGDFLFLANSD